jgi:hypothetical protein
LHITIVTCREIVGGIKNTSLVPDINQIFQLAFLPNNSLVRQCDLTWNQIEPSILMMYQKLIELDFEKLLENEPDSRNLRPSGSHSQRRTQ